MTQHLSLSFTMSYQPLVPVAFLLLPSECFVWAVVRESRCIAIELHSFGQDVELEDSSMIKAVRLIATFELPRWQSRYSLLSDPGMHSSLERPDSNGRIFAPSEAAEMIYMDNLYMYTTREPTSVVIPAHIFLDEIAARPM